MHTSCPRRTFTSGMQMHQGALWTHLGLATGKKVCEISVLGL